MYIKKIKLNNFRNYSEQEIELNNEINVFFGQNAQGKTNIVESIFLCALGKSFRTNKEKEIIKFNASGMARRLFALSSSVRSNHCVACVKAVLFT